MTTAFLIYLYLAIGNIVAIAIGIVTAFGTAYLTVFFALGLFTGFGSSTAPSEEENVAFFKKLSTLGKKALKPVIAAIILICLYPSKTDVAYIIGGATVLIGAQELINNPEAQALPNNLLKAANTFLEGIEDESKD